MFIKHFKSLIFVYNQNHSFRHVLDWWQILFGSKVDCLLVDDFIEFNIDWIMQIFLYEIILLPDWFHKKYFVIILKSSSICTNA